MENLISDLVKLQKEFSFNEQREERESLNHALREISKFANAPKQLERADRLELNRLKTKVTKINATRRQRLVQKRIKEISNMDEVSPITQKFFIAIYKGDAGANYALKCKIKISFPLMY